MNKHGTERGESRRHWTLKFEYNDQGKWLAALSALKDTANKNVQATVKARFENLQESAKQKREFEIEDLDAEISILTTAYDKEIQRTLAHLSEQAAIAKKLGISKQVNIPPPSIYQSLNTQELNTIADNTRKIDTKTPLYLRGYDALEKRLSPLCRGRLRMRLLTIYFRLSSQSF